MNKFEKVMCEWFKNLFNITTTASSEMEYILFVVIIIFLLFLLFRNIFKISYYETKLINMDVDISRVRKMPIYKMWLN